MEISEDLASNLVSGLYLLFNHNALVIAYVAGLVICGVMSFIRPSRLAFLLTTAFLLLTFGYEYDKHLIEALRDQTIATIAPTPGTHLRATKLINIFLSELLPIFFFTAGWGLLISSLGHVLWNKKSSQS